MLITIKEPEKEKSSTYSFKEVMAQIIEPLKDPNYKRFLIAFFLYSIPFTAFNYLIVNLGTFLLKLRGFEFIILAGVAFCFSILSFMIWKMLSKKVGIKKSLSTCLAFSCFSFLLVLILLFPMPLELSFGVGLVIITSCLSNLIGTMIFSIPIISDLIDQSERKIGRNLSGAYTGAYTMIGSIAAGTAMLIISIFLELFGPEAPISYVFILTLGATFIAIAFFIFQKVEIEGSKG